MQTIIDKTIDISLDEMIAKTVYLLNEKGYKTKGSCSGHEESYHQYFYFYVGFFELAKMNIAEIEIIKKKRNFYLCRCLAYFNICFIYFEDVYNFEDLPENFIQRGKSIFSSFSYLNLDNTKKSDEEVREYIRKINEELYLWSESLPYINNYTLKNKP